MAAKHPVVSLADALATAVAGRPPAFERSGDPIMQLNRLIVALGGSMRAAARALGEAPTSVRMWATGQRRMSRKKADQVAPKLMKALRRATLSPIEEQRLRGRQIQITGTDRYDDRYRKITPKGRTADAVVDAYLRAGDLREGFCNAIIDPQDFYPDYFRSDDHDFGIDVERVTFI